MQNDGTNKFLVPAAVVLAGLFIGGAVIWNGSHPVTNPTPTPAGPTVDIKDVKTSGEPYIGQANAPVTIAFWSDFQCPYCKAFEVGGVTGISTPAAFPDILKNYVDTGKVRVIFKDFAFLGNDSMTGAEYGRSVWALYPAQYFAWRTAMYTAQDQEGDQGFGNAASIDKLDATIPGLDANKIKADVAANKAAYDAAINADKAEAQSMGVSATPSFIVGKQLIAGAYPYATFQQAFDALLK
jgi:protein-disulfide isomerase